MITNLSNIQINQIRNLLKKEEKIIACFLLGSYYKGNPDFESDLDLGFILKIQETLDPLEKIQLGTEITFTVGIPVDIGILSGDSLIYSKEAIWKGYKIFDRIPSETQKRVNVLLSQYYQFQMDQKTVIDAYTIR